MIQVTLRFLNMSVSFSDVEKAAAKPKFDFAHMADAIIREKEEEKEMTVKKVESEKAALFAAQFNAFRWEN